MRSGGKCEYKKKIGKTFEPLNGCARSGNARQRVQPLEKRPHKCEYCNSYRPVKPSRIMDGALQIDLSVTAEIKLYYDLYVPEHAATRAPLLIAVHGYGAHKRYMMREARAVAPDGWVIASVQAPHQHFRKKDEAYRVGFGWLTDHNPAESVALHHKFLLDVIGKLAADDMTDRSQVYLFGFSQACALNFRFAFAHPETPAGVIGICGGIPGDLESNPSYKPFNARTFYLYGDDDEFYTQEKFAEFDEKLRERLPDYRSKQYTAKHEITDEMREDIREFLAGDS
jgi:predicted esterase